VTGDWNGWCIAGVKHKAVKEAATMEASFPGSQDLHMIAGRSSPPAYHDAMGSPELDDTC
jgi:hypothetical protein